MREQWPRSWRCRVSELRTPIGRRYSRLVRSAPRRYASSRHATSSPTDVRNDPTPHYGRMTSLAINSASIRNQVARLTKNRDEALADQLDRIEISVQAVDEHHTVSALLRIGQKLLSDLVDRPDKS